MSRRARIGWALALIALLAGCAAWLVLGEGEDGTRESPEPPAAASTGVRERAFEAARQSARRDERRRARAADPGAEPGPRPAARRLYAQVRNEAEPVARGLHRAFARYELGDANAAALRASATPALARELLRSAPRPVAGARPSRPARLGRLELVALDGDRAGQRLTVIELVGSVRRGRERERIAIEMRRRNGRWLVVGLGL